MSRMPRKLMYCVGMAAIIYCLGLCAAWAQDAGTTGMAVKPENQKVMPSQARDGKTIYDCFRGLSVGGAVLEFNENEIESFKRLHGGFCFGRVDLSVPSSLGGGNIGQAHEAGILQFPMYGLGWSCPADKNPAWSVKKPDGSVLVSGQYACWNSPFRDYTIARIENIVKNPSVDGLLLDAVWWGVMGYDADNTDWCCCEYCKKAYRDRFGEAMPFHP